MDFVALKLKVIKVVNLFCKHEDFIIERNINERSITHKLAEYLQHEFEEYHVDCEYNRKINDGIDREYIRKTLNLYIEDTKTNNIEAKTVFPDIIIHQRGTNKNNLLVIEVKKASNKNKKDIEFDVAKIEGYREQLGYEFGLFLVIGYEQEIRYKMRWFGGIHDHNNIYNAE